GVCARLTLPACRLMIEGRSRKCAITSRSKRSKRASDGWVGMTLQFGVFDHLDRNDLPLCDYYEQRLKVIEAFDRSGFYAYHVAEHHFTPLGMAPSPSVFLSAIGQRTKRLRFGTFVYALPVHH